MKPKSNKNKIAPSNINNIEIFIDEDGSVTFTDLPPEFQKIVEELGGLDELAPTCSIEKGQPDD